MLKRYLNIVLAFSFASLSAAVPANKASTPTDNTEMQKRQAIINEDQMNPTDIYAIPLDDSEEEEEEEMQMLKAREQKFIQKQNAGNNK